MSRLNIIAAAAIRSTAQALMESMAGDSAKYVLCIPLVPIGSPPGTAATHWAGTGYVGDDMAGLLLDAQALADAAGVPLANAEFLLGQADISSLEDESFEAACTRLGLQKQEAAL